MFRPPSDDDIERMVIELCRAAVTLRMAETHGALATGGESARLADGIEAWLTACEPQIAPIIAAKKAPRAPAGRKCGVVTLDEERRRRPAGPHPDAPEAARCEPPARSESELRWSGLRESLSLVSARLREV